MGFYFYEFYEIVFLDFKAISPYQITTTFFNMGLDLVLKGFLK
jgi:hypothetical protein